MSRVSGADRWIFVAILAGIIGLGIGFYFLFDWASDRSPWVFRVVVVLFFTSIGYRLGRELKTRPADAKGVNWAAVGTAAVALSLAGYFGMIRPALKDRERDRAFGALLADAREVVERFEAVARDQPIVESGKHQKLEFQFRNIAALEKSIAWMSRYQQEMDQYTPEQRRELHEEFKRITEANKSAREKLALLDDAPKKKEQP